MIRSQPVIVENRVLGIAVTHPAGWHFVATDPVVGDLHGQVFPSVAEAGRVAGLVLAHARAVPSTLPRLCRPPALHRVD